MIKEYTYGELLNEFQKKSMSEIEIVDWRPYNKDYLTDDETYLGIIIWLKNGDRVIYEKKIN